MRWPAAFRVRLKSLFNRARTEQERQKELQFHLAQFIDENMNAGMRKGEARFAALRMIGSLGKVQEECSVGILGEGDRLIRSFKTLCMPSARCAKRPPSRLWP